MKKSIQSLLLLFFLLTLAMDGCIPAPTSVPPSPTSTSTPEPTPTATLTATATPVPSPTAVPPVWIVNMQIDLPLEFSEKQYGYHYFYKKISESGIVLDRATRWSIDVQVDELPGGAGNGAGVDLLLEGYTEDGQAQVLRLSYNGYWSISYQASAGPSSGNDYYQEMRHLDAPGQHFELSLDQDGNMRLENQDGFLKSLDGSELFSESQVIYTSLTVGPRRKITISNLKTEQLQVPSVVTAPAISLEKPYTETFEKLDPSQPTEISPFVFPDRKDLFELFDTLGSKTGTYTSWAVDTSRARSGKIALNAIPNGNPVTEGMVPLTVAFLEPVFDVKGYQTVSLKLWFNSTSNPSVSRVHNCESDLAVYARLDAGPWTPYGVICGEHETETQGWQNTLADFDVSGKSTIQFAFVYEVQDAKPDPTAYFLIDDLEIIAK